MGRGYLATPRGWQETMVVEAVSGRADHFAILPRRTYLPLIEGLVTWGAILCILFKLYPLAAGLTVVLATLFILGAQGAGLERDCGPCPWAEAWRCRPTARSATRCPPGA